MAEKIRGITIEIGGDTKGLTKALQGVNKEIKGTEKSLKDVERLLKLDPKNTELLAQKQKLLADASTQAAKKVEDLHKIEKQMSDAGIDKNSAQFMALRREIVEAEASLKDAKKASDEFSVSLAKVEASAGKVSSAAGKIASATKGLSTAAGAGLAGLVGLGINAARSADDLNTLAKQSGLTTAELQKMQYASDLVDVDADTIIGGLRKLKKAMTSTSSDTVAAWDRIGVATTDANGELRNSTDVFYETLQGLANISNETERDAIAMQLFGKSADELAGIIDDGGAALRYYGDEAERLGYVLDQETLDSMNEVNDKLDELKMKASGTLAKSGAKALEALTPVIDTVVNALGSFLEKLGELSPQQLQLIAGVLAVVAAIAPIATIIAKVAAAIQALLPIIASLKVAMAGVSLTTVGIIAGVVALVALIATKGEEIKAILQGVDDFLQNIFAKDFTEVLGPVLGEALNGFFATVSNVWDSVKGILDGIIDFIQGVFSGDWKRAWDGIKEILGGVWNGIVSVVKAPLNAIIALINGAINGINMMIDGLNRLSFTIPSWVPGLGGRSFGLNLGHIGNIPYLANGGVLSQGSAVVGEAGPELLTMMGGKAVVQPLSNNNTTNVGGVSITVYGAPGQDVHELADIIMDEMQAATERRSAVFA